MKKVGKDDVQVDTKESMMKTRGQESMRFRMTGKYEEDRRKGSKRKY